MIYIENNEIPTLLGKNILVLCTGNSCRSKLAHGYLKNLTRGKANIYSAGIETHGVNPRAIKVMTEESIDISGHTSNLVDEYKDVDFDYVITVCDHAKERCSFPHQSGTNPSEFFGSCKSCRNS